MEEARLHLGNDWIKTETPELMLAEAIYNHFDVVNFFMNLMQSKRLIVSGGAGLAESVLVFNKKKK